MRRASALLAALALAAALGGCGRKGEPAPPGPATAITYPKGFPPATGP